VQIAWAGLFKAVGLQNHVWPNTTTRALFTQETFDITANLGITVGVRYNEDRKRVPAQSYNLLTDTFTLPLITKEASWPSWTPKVSLQYQATPAALLYTSYSEGFKGGGFDYQITRNAFLPYGPEKVKSYEAGFKSTWLDRRVQLNGAAYYEDYRDIQLAATVQPGTFNCPVTALPSCSQILNASTAHIKGAELDLIAVPVEHLHVETSAGYISQRLTQINPLLIASGSTIPAAQLPRTPKWTGSVGAQYDLPISFGTVSLRGDYSYRSLQYFDYTNSPILAQAGYGLLNGKLSFLTPDEHWELAVSVQNATDKRYINTGYFSNVFNFASVHYGTPRIVLGSVKFRF
jgi:iron complex outermembrane receptor protein